MKKLNQIIKVLTIAMVFCIALMSNEAYAANTLSENNSDVIMVADNDLPGIISAGSEWIDQANKDADGNDEISGMDVLDFVDKFAGIGQILVAVGVVTLLIVGGVMAVQWITATPEKQAKLKTQLIGLVISAVVIFGAIGIWSFIRGIGDKIETELQNGTTTTTTNTTKDTKKITVTDKPVYTDDSSSSNSTGTHNH